MGIETDDGRVLSTVPAKKSASDAAFDWALRAPSTAEAIMSAAVAAFDPRCERVITKKEMIQTCAALLNFLQTMQTGQQRSPAEWKNDIEHMEVALGK